MGFHHCSLSRAISCKSKMSSREFCLSLGQNTIRLLLQQQKTPSPELLHWAVAISIDIKRRNKLVKSPRTISLQTSDKICLFMDPAARFPFTTCPMPGRVATPPGYCKPIMAFLQHANSFQRPASQIRFSHQPREECPGLKFLFERSLALVFSSVVVLYPLSPFLLVVLGSLISS